MSDPTHINEDQMREIVKLRRADGLAASELTRIAPLKHGLIEVYHWKGHRTYVLTAEGAVVVRVNPYAGEDS